MRRLAALALLLVVAGCGGDSDPGPPRPPLTTSAGASTTHVLLVSIDGLNPEALSPRRTPTLTRLFAQGLGTRNARTEYEQTDTLPNHTGMVTGRPISTEDGGHGVTWNDEFDQRTVQDGAGEEVESVFTVIHAAGGTSAVFAGKPKFVIFERSWPHTIDRAEINGDEGDLVDDAVALLAERRPTLTFVHLARPDQAGHDTADFMGPEYLDAVAEADADLGRLVDAAGDDSVVIVTADHGGDGASHREAADPDNYTIPFVVAGPGVPAGDAYDHLPTLADPGTGRPDYEGPQPLRNCMAADLATEVLGLEPVPGSTCDTGPITP